MSTPPARGAAGVGEKTLGKLILLLLRGFKSNFDSVGWKVQRSSNKPETPTSRILETCDPVLRRIVLYPDNHKLRDGPLEQTTLHALIHTSLMLSSDPQQERIVIALERLLWPRLPATYLRWLQRLVRDAERRNGRFKVDRT